MPDWTDLYRSVVMPEHCDHYGHLNVRHYAGFFNDASWHMMSLAGIKRTDLQARGLGSVVANLTIDFHHEITVGQLFLIRGAVRKVGEKSFTHEQRLYEIDTMTLCASQKVVEVCFDMGARRAVAFPEDMKAKLLASVVAD